MKIIKGTNKSKFINDYCNINKEIQFLLIDTTDNTYPFECKNLLILKSDKNNWLKDLINADDELSKDVEFFLFTNDDLNEISRYKNQLEEFNREIIIALQGKSKFMMGETELEEI